jgi:retron-type reverse transcriptase
MAWEKVKANRGSGGVDGQTLEAFEAQLEQQLERLHRELREETYQPLPVRQHRIPKRGKPGEYRMLGIPSIYDRVRQHALLNRLEPIFEPLFDDASFGYRRGRSTKSEQIYSFHWSPDGKNLGILRGHTDSDVVLLQESKP